MFIYFYATYPYIFLYGRGVGKFCAEQKKVTGWQDNH